MKTTKSNRTLFAIRGLEKLYSKAKESKLKVKSDLKNLNLVELDLKEKDNISKKSMNSYAEHVGHRYFLHQETSMHLRIFYLDKDDKLVRLIYKGTKGESIYPNKTTCKELFKNWPPTRVLKKNINELCHQPPESIHQV